MLSLTPTQSYQINQTNELFEKKKIELQDNQNENPFQLGINLLIGFLSIEQIGIVSAEFPETNTGATAYPSTSETDLTWNCCVKTNAGAICQDIISSNTNSCATEAIPTKCEQVAECKIGCCIDEDEGLCTTKATKAKCEDDGGKWEDEENCLINECQKGCCVLGAGVEFTTPQRCQKLSSLRGVEKDFRDLTTELECIALKESQDWGACVLEDQGCRFTTEFQCLEIKGEFNKNLLCSAESLNTLCEKQKAVNCVEDKDEIYWFDSCGNQENIYSSDKDFSWNNGEVLKKQDSCNPDSANINSKDCGNCNYFLGSKCSESTIKKIKDGDFVCENLNCVDENGNSRKNGESWCVYDSSIGEVESPWTLWKDADKNPLTFASDPAGSRHWKRVCIDGEVKVEPCADYRGQICVESKIESDESSKDFSIAACVINDAVNCVNYNEDKETMKDKCEENTQCMVKRINVEKGFNFDFCIGKYPRGFDLTGEQNSETSKQLCAMADQTCVVIYEKKISGWKCVINCDCEDRKFAEQMNDLCISLGDCGTYINYLGEGTDNIKVEKSKQLFFEDMKHAQFAEPQKDKVAEPQSIEQILEAIYGKEQAEALISEPGNLQKGIQMLGTVAGGVGVSITGVVAVATTTQLLAGGEGSLAVLNFKTIATGGPTIVPATWAATLQGVATAAQSIGVMVGVGLLISKLFGLKGEAATIMAVASAVVAVAAMFITKTLAGCIGSGPAFLICVGILILIAIILKLFGIGKTKKIKVNFTCMPWQAPIGGKDCDECNDDPLKPCSKYRCSSLGQACKLLNEQEENPVCVASENTGKFPIITPGTVGYGFQFQNPETSRVEIRTNDNECIPEFAPVLFTLDTDKYAQCKWSFEQKDNFEELEEYFAEANSFSKNHTSVFLMPSLESLNAYNITGDIKEKFANTNIYVRCQDDWGNYNKKPFAVNFCIKSGPDTTVATIIKTTPVNEAFLKYKLTEIPLTAYLNEPADCKISSTDQEYDAMTESMECETGLESFDKFGWPCSTQLTGLTESDNSFYIRCKDQPWLHAENTSRNINTESYAYTLHGSKSELKIDSVSPSGEIEEGFEPISLDLKVETSGGIDSGTSRCSYSFTDYNNLIGFQETYSSSHKQNFNQLVRGTYEIKVECKDDAGNSDRSNTTIKLNIDSTSPKIVRAYNQGNQLSLTTNEKAKCFYDFDHCHFNMENATEMTTAFSTTHSSDWVSGKTYHIKCEDIWGNQPDGCSIKLSPSN